jgi:hypothetical protein
MKEKLTTEIKSRGNICYKCGWPRERVTDNPLICWDVSPLGYHQWERVTDENSE